MRKIIALLFLICGSSHLYAINRTWVGTTDNMNTPTNWNPAGVPGAADVGIFDATGISHTPLIDASFTITGLTFLDGQNYTFINLFPVEFFDVENGGINNEFGGFQTFNFLNDGITFTNCSADVNSSGRITYDVANTNINFANNSNAGAATINASTTSNILFQAGASGDTAAVHLATNSTLQLLGGNLSLGSLGSDASGLVSLLANDLTTGSNNLSTNFQGVASGVNGSITKVGTGTFTISGINTYTGPTTVDDGILSLTGTIAGNFVVNANGTSNGTGTVGGSYTQNDGSFFLVDTFGFLDVTGPVTLNGGEVAVADAVFDPYAAPFIILHSDVARTGEFDGAFFLNPNAYYAPILSYDAQNVYLSFASQFQSFALTPNEIAVASAIDSITDPTAEQLVLITALSALDEAGFLAALNELSGEQYANLVILGERTSHRFFRQIYDPFRPDFACPCNTLCVGRTVGWISTQGGQSFLKSDENARGFKQYDVNVSLGVHQYLLPNIALGVAGNYEYNRVNFYQSGTGNANSFQGAFYALYDNPYGYLFLEGGGGHTHWKINRQLSFLALSAASAPNVRFAAGYGEVGLNFWLDRFLVQPFAGLDYGHYWRSTAQENGAAAANLFINEESYESCESRIGAHLAASYGWLLLSADAAWRHRYNPLNNEVSLNFLTFGPEFTILGPEQNRDAFEGALYIGAPIFPTVSAYLEASGEVWNQFASYGITLGLQKVW